MYRLTAGPPATGADLRAARERGRLLAAELTRVREAAAAWRNGLGGLLVALVAFSLVKGRSDIGQLAPLWAAVVGVLLAVALIIGAAGALLLIRAANGPPAVASTSGLLVRSAADHREALAAAVALRWGILLTLCCVTFLVAAVGVTWYGPPRDQADLQIMTPSGTVCGSIAGIDQGSLTLKTADENVTVDLSKAATIQILDRCPEPGT